MRREHTHASREARGTITIFLSIILVPFMVIVGGLMEVNHYNSTMSMTDEALGLAAVSTLSQYDQYLLDRWGLMATRQDLDLNASESSNVWSGRANSSEVLGGAIAASQISISGVDEAALGYTVNSGLSASAAGTAPSSNTGGSVLLSQIKEYSKQNVPLTLGIEYKNLYDEDETTANDIIQQLEGEGEQLGVLRKMADASSEVTQAAKSFVDAIDDDDPSTEDLMSIAKQLDAYSLRYETKYQELSDSLDDYLSVCGSYRAASAALATYTGSGSGSGGTSPASASSGAALSGGSLHVASAWTGATPLRTSASTKEDPEEIMRQFEYYTQRVQDLTAERAHLIQELTNTQMLIVDMPTYIYNVLHTDIPEWTQFVANIKLRINYLIDTEIPKREQDVADMEATISNLADQIADTRSSIYVMESNHRRTADNEYLSLKDMVRVFDEHISNENDTIQSCIGQISTSEWSLRYVLDNGLVEVDEEGNIVRDADGKTNNSLFNDAESRIADCQATREAAERRLQHYRDMYVAYRCDAAKTLYETLGSTSTTSGAGSGLLYTHEQAIKRLGKEKDAASLTGSLYAILNYYKAELGVSADQASNGKATGRYKQLEEAEATLGHDKKSEGDPTSAATGLYYTYYNAIDTLGEPGDDTVVPKKKPTGLYATVESLLKTIKTTDTDITSAKASAASYGARLSAYYSSLVVARRIADLRAEVARLEPEVATTGNRFFGACSSYATEVDAILTLLTSFRTKADAALAASIGSGGTSTTPYARLAQLNSISTLETRYAPDDDLANTAALSRCLWVLSSNAGRMINDFDNLTLKGSGTPSYRSSTVQSVIATVTRAKTQTTADLAALRAGLDATYATDSFYGSAVSMRSGLRSRKIGVDGYYTATDLATYLDDQRNYLFAGMSDFASQEKATLDGGVTYEAAEEHLAAQVDTTMPQYPAGLFVSTDALGVNTVAERLSAMHMSVGAVGTDLYNRRGVSTLLGDLLSALGATASEGLRGAVARLQTLHSTMKTTRGPVNELMGNRLLYAAYAAYNLPCRTDYQTDPVTGESGVNFTNMSGYRIDNGELGEGSGRMLPTSTASRDTEFTTIVDMFDPTAGVGTVGFDKQRTFSGAELEYLFCGSDDEVYNQHYTYLALMETRMLRSVDALVDASAGGRVTSLATRLGFGYPLYLVTVLMEEGLRDTNTLVAGKTTSLTRTARDVEGDISSDVGVPGLDTIEASASAPEPGLYLRDSGALSYRDYCMLAILQYVDEATVAKRLQGLVQMEGYQYYNPRGSARGTQFDLNKSYTFVRLDATLELNSILPFGAGVSRLFFTDLKRTQYRGY